MSKINWMRVLLGGLLAGLVFNVLEGILGALYLGREYGAALEALGHPMSQSAGTMVHYLALGFLFGIAIVAIYAFIRPRFGPGPRTAVYAGLIAWFMSGVIDALAEAPMGLLPLRLHVVWMIAWLIELPLVALAGAWLYREGA